MASQGPTIVQPQPQRSAVHVPDDKYSLSRLPDVLPFEMKGFETALDVVNNIWNEFENPDREKAFMLMYWVC